MIKKEVPTFAAYVPDLAPTPPFHYPGDNETFATSTRLTDVLGLKTLGIGLDVISPGRRSCYPHAHTHEEEFAFVLEGKAKVWLNGEVKEMSSGEGLAFLPGSGISHCLINDSAEPITFMGIGENRQFPDEELIYPLHPLRNKEGQRKNWYWNEAEKFPIGPHNGKPEKPIPEHLKLRLCSEQDAEEVFKILETSPEYSLKVDGCLPTLKIAKEAISSGPKKRSETYFKEFLIIEYNEKPIGVVDLYANHPEKGFTYLGLLLIGEHLFGQGLGGKCFGLVSDYVKRSFQTKTIRLGVSDDHDVSGFWKKMGFQPNGRTYSWQGETKTSNVIEYNKDL
ncbi:MAG: GNAT family N-acetyltransferase [Bdellovibrionales bacterium]